MLLDLQKILFCQITQKNFLSLFEKMREELPPFDVLIQSLTSEIRNFVLESSDFVHNRNVGSINTIVAGSYYYGGKQHLSGRKTLVRDPNCVQDTNCIWVVNSRGETIGCVPRQIAARLAPLMDTGRVTATPSVSGAKNRYGWIKLRLEIATTAERAPEIARIVREIPLITRI